MHEIRLTQEGAFLVQKCLTGNMTLPTSNQSFETCGPEAITSTTNIEKCGRKTSSGGLERYILINPLRVSSPTPKCVFCNLLTLMTE